MRVAVTGAGGFLGRHLVDKLLAAGDEVVGIDLGFAPPLPPTASTVKASVTDAAAMRAALEGADALIHAAAISGLWTRHRGDFERVNVGGTRTVLAAAAAAGVARAVHVSSFVTLISGPPGGGLRHVDESLELPPEALLGPYPRSKRLAELAACAAEVPTAIVQPPGIIGPGDHRLTPPMAMLLDLANGRLPAMLEATWALMDVRALAAGVLAALQRGRHGRRYLLTGEMLQTDELLARFPGPTPRARVPYWLAWTAAQAEEGLAALTGRPPRASVTGVRLAGRRIAFDNTRAVRELDFEPWPVAPAMRDALLWLRAQGRLTRTLPELG